MKHAGTAILDTARLHLRPFTPDDAEMMFRNWASDPAVTRYLTWPVHTSADASRSLLESWCREYTDPTFYHWAIADRETGEVFGDISVVDIDENTRSIELGYCICPERWGKGYTSEAAKAVVDYLFRRTDTLRITARHDVDNPGSGGVMRKIGMTREGILRQSARNNQGIVDVVHYSLLKNEYEEMQHGFNGTAQGN